MKALDATKSNPRQGGPSFSMRNRFFRAIWSSAWLVLARFTPAPFHLWRVFLLRCFGAKIHYSARVYGSASIWYPPNLEMQQYSILGPGSICYCMEAVTIGEYAIVSQRAHLCCGTHDPDDAHFQLFAKPICIGKHAWIAAEAFVGPGVTVGDGAILGARAVAMRDVDSWSIWAGNPARRIRDRKRY